MPAPFSGDDYSTDLLLGDRVRLTQPLKGYRVAMDTILLAAAVPAKPGQAVLEAGLGSAGAALCLAERVADILIKGVEADPEMRALAAHNIQQNGRTQQITVADGWVQQLVGDGSDYDHVYMNPPYLAEGKAIMPPNANKGAAHMATGSTLADWLRFAIHHTRARGTITLVYRADHLDQIVAGLSGSTGDITICPLWPRLGQAAKRVIVQARKGSQGRSRLLPGIPLHGSVERYSEAVKPILTGAAPLLLD